MRINPNDIRCPRCKSTEVVRDQSTGSDNIFVCNECDFEFAVGHSKLHRQKPKHRDRHEDPDRDNW